MFPKEIVFKFYKRRNVHVKSGVEWVLGVSLDGAQQWVITTWNRKPTDDQIQDAKTIILRSCDVYHRHLSVPSFELKEVEP